MKRYLLFMLLLTASALHAQTYIPIPDSNAVWRVDMGWAPYPFVYSYRYQYVMSNQDTVINGKSYSKLEKSGWGSMYNTQNGYYSEGYFNSGYWGGLREENKQVWFVAPNDTVRKLIYDFNLGLGDTIPNGINNQYISGIDSILLDGVYHKRYLISNATMSPSMAGDTSIIEGIGAASGLLEELLYGIESGSSLICFSQDNNTIFPDTASGCPLITGIHELRDDLFFIAYPNPAREKITFSSLDKLEKISVYDTFGRLVHQSFPGSTSFELDMESYARGMYLVVISGKKGSFTSRRIILE